MILSKEKYLDITRLIFLIEAQSDIQLNPNNYLGRCPSSSFGEKKKKRTCELNAPRSWDLTKNMTRSRIRLRRYR